MLSHLNDQRNIALNALESHAERRSRLLETFCPAHLLRIGVKVNSAH